MRIEPSILYLIDTSEAGRLFAFSVIKQKK